MNSAHTVRRRLVSLQRRFMNSVPAQLASRLDSMVPALAKSWGGPLNGQLRRCEIVSEIADAVTFDRVVETGTFRGTSTQYLLDTFAAPVNTVEAASRFYLYSKRRFRGISAITLVKGDSRELLRMLSAEPGAAEETVFFYLDAHWEEDLPLREELEAIAATWKHAVVMVDDFEVPGDSGYGFDDYGHGKALTAKYLPMDHLEHWTLLYPSAPSADETGAKRGCCVLVSPPLASDVAKLPTLRAAQAL